MNPLDTLLMASQAIARNKMRSFLTMLGVIIGVGSVIAMVHLAQSATRSVTDQISSIGSNLLFVSPSFSVRGAGGVRRPAPAFDMNDVEAMRREIPGIIIAPTASQTATVIHGSINDEINIEGTTNEYFSVRNHPVVRGRAFEENELLAGAAVCVVGQTVVDEMYEHQEPLGSLLRIDRTACRVIGVLEKKGLSGGQDPDHIILMPIKSVQRRLAGNLDVRTIYVSALQDGTSSRVKSDIESLLRQRRRIKSPVDDDFRVRDTQDILDALAETTATMSLLLGGIAAVSLLVGGIGIMNIMLVSVTERTREIGIRLAIGARSRDVLTQFLVESIVLATFGGVLGVALGLGGTWLMTSQFGMPFVMSVGVLLLGFGFAICIGVIFGILPARKAARLNPIDALRHE